MEMGNFSNYFNVFSKTKKNLVKWIFSIFNFLWGYGEGIIGFSRIFKVLFPTPPIEP